MLGHIKKHSSRILSSSDPNDTYHKHAVSLSGRELADAFAVDRIALGGRFGVELEMEKITLTRVREVVAEVLGPYARDVLRGVLDRQGRLWEVKPDLYDISELATPPLENAEDIRMLQRIAERLTRAGAVCSDETGVHVHVDAKGLTENQIVRLLELVGRYESTLFSALGVHANRYFYCGDAPRTSLPAMLAKPPEGRPALMRAYRGTRPVKCLGLNVEHLAPTRLGTLEFRYFNGTLNPSILAAHVGFALAMTRYARQSAPLHDSAVLNASGLLPDATDLAGLLVALSLEPRDPSSIFLFRHSSGLSMPVPEEAAPEHARPSRADIALFTNLGVRREAAIEVLYGLEKPSRRLLLVASLLYLKETGQKYLHSREMLALSRLSADVQQQVVSTAARAIGTLGSAEERGDAIAWFGLHIDNLPQIEKAFGEFTLPYLIAAPATRALPLLKALDAAGFAFCAFTLSAAAFQKLAHMPEALRDLHIRVWRDRIQTANPPSCGRAILDHVIACFDGVAVDDIRRVLQMLDAAGVAFKSPLVSPACFHGLAALPDARPHLALWLTYGPKLCATDVLAELFLEDMLDQPLDLFARQLDLVTSLLGEGGGYHRVRNRMKLLNTVTAEHLGAIRTMLERVAPHVKNPATLGQLSDALTRVDNATLLDMADHPWDLRDVPQRVEVDHVLGVIRGDEAEQ